VNARSPDNITNHDSQVRDGNWIERALGSKGRSAGQYDIWQAVYSPQGSDGYPAPIFDKLTGAIDKGVAAYWREHYDLRHIMQRDWATLGPQLKGKLHLYVGDMDTFYLNNAVYQTWGSVALSLCTTVHPLWTVFTKRHPINFLKGQCDRTLGLPHRGLPEGDGRRHPGRDRLRGPLRRPRGALRVRSHWRFRKIMEAPIILVNIIKSL
jgi:hypothetical protein